MTTTRTTLPTFVGAESLSLLGYSAFLVVLPWLIVTRTGSAATTGMVVAVVTVPSLVAAIVGGRVIDHYGRRRTSLLATLGCAAAAAAFGLVDATVGLSVAWLIALGVLANVFIMPSTTARDALMGDVATTSGVTLERIAGLRQVAFGVSFLVGPALAGVLIAVMPPIRVMWLIAACWALAAGLTWALPAIDMRGAPGAAGGDSRTLWSAVRRSPAIVAAMVIGFGSCIITEPMTSVILPAHFRSVHQPQEFGLAMSAFAVGSIVGSLCYAVAVSRSRRAVYVGGFTLATTGIAIFAMLPGFWLLAAGLLSIGIGSGLVTPFFMVAITQNTAESQRGRILGLYNALSLGASPVGLGLLALLLAGHGIGAGAVAVLVVWVATAGFALSNRALIDPPLMDDAEGEKIGAC